MDAIKKPQNGAGNGGKAATPPTISRQDFGCVDDYWATCVQHGQTVTIADWRVGAVDGVRDAVQLELGTFNGKPQLKVRKWSREDGGTWQPDGHILTLDAASIDDFRVALTRATKVASRAGLFQSPAEREKAAGRKAG